MKNLLLVFALVSLFSCKKETVTLVENEETYKTYKASITQVGTEAPSVIIEFNDLGVDIVWKRGSFGQYGCVELDLFNESNTFVNIGNAVGGYVNFQLMNSSSLNIYTRDLNGTPKDGLLTNTPIEIRVYD